jgi:hypothetical protein
MPEKDEWREIKLPLNLWDRWRIQFARILLANGEAPGALVSEDSKVRIAARLDAMEKLLILCERTESSETFRV